MFDFSWGEVVVIGVVALVVIGPKELPGVLRTVGQAVGKVRRMASEFQGQFQEAMREAEMHEARKSIEGIGESVSTSFNPIQTIRDEIKGVTEPPPVMAPPTTIAVPPAPPVPDLTPDQIKAAFAPEPAPPRPAMAPADEGAAPASEPPEPAKPKRRSKKAASEDGAA